MAASLTPPQRDEARAALPHGPGVLEMPRGNRKALARGIMFISNAAMPDAGQHDMPPVTGKPSSASPAHSPGYDPHAPMDPKTYSDYIDALNRRINASPATGTVLVVDLSKHKTYQDVAEISGDYFHKRPSGIKEKLNANLAAEIAQYGGMQASTLHSPESNAADPNFASLVLPLGPSGTAWSLYTRLFLERGVTPGQWSNGIGTPFAHHQTAAHEVYHGLNGHINSTGQTPEVLVKRGEIGADVFSVLYLAQQNEPDLDRQLKSFIQFRDAHAVVEQNLYHNSGDALQQLSKDLPKLRANPDFYNWPLGELVAQADQYARTSLKKDYPHLYSERAADLKVTNDIQSFAELGKSIAVDKKLLSTVHYARESLNDFADAEKPQDIDTRQAALLLRASEAINAITGNNKNGLAAGVRELRAMHPQAFKEAEQELGIAPHTEPSSGQKHSKGIAPAKKVGTNSIQKPSFAPLDPFG